MKKKKLFFMLMLAVSVFMSSSLVLAADTDHSHDEDCVHGEYDHIEETREFSLADLILNDQQNGITRDYSEYSQYSLADEYVNEWQSQNVEMSMSTICSHPSYYVSWTVLSSTKQYGGFKDGYCYKTIVVEHGMCNYCSRTTQVIETTSYAYHNYPSNGGQCKNGCTMWLLGEETFETIIIPGDE